ncbi:translocation/assembly module TamB domain-containing protein [Marinobacter sp. SS21]|uniref:translocation/assembly module TamB domain-containing protein n=1 Tax=Marinobacter sp. SS21 TaxID=2979460 RepID=UPI00232ADA31|nr:translocation/assembly module TamB domain-containing protein [Marinobacter sp. SS21]MDC0662187.1 translocation/assembly module TamB [Marinobacter sp. SS21]
MKRHVHWLRWLGGSLLLVVVLLVLVVTALIMALRSDPGTRWVLGQVPGLEIRGDQGTLLGQWQAQWLRWRGYGVELELVAPFVDWSPSCLLQKRLCLDVLRAERIRLDTQPDNGTEPSTQVQLPALELPIALVVGDIHLGPLALNGNTVWTNAKLAASSSGSAWIIDHLHYQLDDISVSAQGRVETRGDWPLNLSVVAELPPPHGDEWRVDLELAGSVEALRVTGASAGYLSAQLQGSVKPLDSTLPAQLKLTSPRFRTLDTLPETLTLHDWSISLQGSLAQGFRTRSRATLEGTEGPVQADVQGLLTTSAVNELRLTLESPASADAAAGQWALHGDLSWQEGLVAEAKAELQRFPWYSLWPDLAPAAVKLETLMVEGRYDNGAYQADLEAAVSGPMGEASLTGRAVGDLASVRLDRLILTTGAGKARGEVAVDYAEAMAWDGRLNLDQFDPGYWLPWLQAQINGEVTSTGRLDEGGLQLAAAWRLDGRWQGQDASSRGTVSGQGEGWTVSDATLNVGANQLQAKGEWGEQVSGQLSLAFPDPAALLPELAGQLSARLRVSGAPDALDGELRATGSGLAWGDSATLDSLTLAATLSKGESVDASAEARTLTFAGQSIDRVALSLTGTVEEHVVTLESRQRELITQLAASGSWHNGWLGQLTEGLLALPEQEQRWALQRPMAIAYQLDNRLTLGGHCWRWKQSTVCADEQVLMPELQIRYQLSQFPTSALAPLLPDTLRWQSLLSGGLSLSLPDQDPNGLINLQAERGSFDVYLVDEWHAIAYEKLSAQLTLTPTDATIAVDLAGPELGTFSSQVRLDPSQEGYPMDGRFELQGLDLTLLGPLLDLESVGGRLDGSGRLAGPLQAPQVYGEVALSQGQLIDQRVPIPLEDVALGLELRGRSADVSGRWKSSDRSEGQLDGELNWGDKPSVSMNVRGSRLPITYEPYADLELEPDLSVRFANGALQVSGSLAVPRGTVKIRRLPEQAVAVSEDEVIVGEAAQEPVVRSILMDVMVSVGEDQVSFDGFGVLGDLEGTLRLGNNLDTRGVLQLTHGTFEAYGQELELRRARLVFVGPLAEPYLDIEAIRKVDTVVAGIRLSGPVSEPQTDVFSEPSMSQGDALSYVILGRPLRSEGDQGQVSQAAISLGLTQASKVTQKIGEEIGIEEFILETEGSGEEAAVVASGYITDKLSLRYGVGIFDPISTVALRYDLGRYFYLEAASGLAASLDIFYTRDF